MNVAVLRQEQTDLADAVMPQVAAQCRIDLLAAQAAEPGMRDVAAGDGAPVDLQELVAARRIGGISEVRPQVEGIVDEIGVGASRAVEVVQSGLIGSVREVHVWSNRPVWPQGMGRPNGSDPIPA